MTETELKIEKTPNNSNIPYKKQKRATTKVAQLHLLHQLHLFLVAYSLLSFITVITPLTPFTPKNGHTRIF